MLKKLIPIATTFAITAVLVAVLMMNNQTTAQDTDLGLPYNADGTWIPEYFPVNDDDGNVVGVVRSEDTFGEEDVHPHPVYDVDNTDVQVGWLGEYGYYGLHDEPPWCLKCMRVSEGEGPDGTVRITDTYNADFTITRTTERIGTDGETTTTVETIEAGTDGTPGPTGSVND